MTIWGNHSSTQYPDFYNAKINGRSAAEAITDEAWLKGQFINSVQQRGAAIIKARGASSAASAANAVIDTVRSIVEPTPANDWHSLCICSEGSYGVEALLLAGAGILIGAAGWSWVRQAGQRALLDRSVLRVPWAGSTIRRFATSQLARTLSTLLGGGLPLVNAIDIASRSMTNRFLSAEMREVGQRVMEGEAFAPAVAARGQFPDVFVKMAEVGESTGALQEMMASLADFYDEEVEAELGRCVSLVEPVLLIVMGLVIASLLLALYMPLFQLTSVVGACY